MPQLTRRCLAGEKSPSRKPFATKVWSIAADIELSSSFSNRSRHGPIPWLVETPVIDKEMTL